MLHQMAPEAKLVGLFAFALAAVAVPAPGFVPLSVAIVVGAVLLASTGVRLRQALTRLAVEIPFLVFALVLPFVATGPRVAVGPLLLSGPGLVGAWLLAAKATAAVLAATAFSVTTTPRDLVLGLQRLRVPATLVAILSFMVRYAGVVLDELGRMRIARESRGFASGSLRSWPTLARSLGALFVRSFERGERVHLAMISRGWSGEFPTLQARASSPRDWLRAGVPAAIVCAVALGAPLVVST